MTNDLFTYSQRFTVMTKNIYIYRKYIRAGVYSSCLRATGGVSPEPVASHSQNANTIK